VRELTGDGRDASECDRLHAVGVDVLGPVLTVTDECRGRVAVDIERGLRNWRAANAGRDRIKVDAATGRDHSARCAATNTRMLRDARSVGRAMKPIQSSSREPRSRSSYRRS
jgi:hypothetical protein